MINLNDETFRAILETASRFAQRELMEQVEQRDAYPHAEFSRESIRQAGEAGLLFLTAPEDLGGTALPAEAWALVLERIAAADAGFAACLLAHALAAEAILRWGSAGLKSKYLGADPPLFFGYPLYLQAGDPQGLPAAVKDKNGYLLSGMATLAANAPVADAAVIAAQFEDGEPSLFVAPISEEMRPAPVSVLGLRSCPLGHLDFADITVPADHLLAKGRSALAELHDLFYPAATAILLATLKSSLDYAIEYGRERWQGGRMIHEHTQLRTMYGRMAIEHQVLREAWLKVMSDNGRGGESRLALKIMAGDLAVRGVTDGVQLLGGYGYTMDYPQERKMRDARQAAELLGSPSRLRLALVDDLIGGGKS